MIYAAFIAFILWEFIALTYFTYYFTFRSPNLIQGERLDHPERRRVSSGRIDNTRDGEGKSVASL